MNEYLKEILKIPILTQEEYEQTLKLDREQMEQVLIERNLRLVGKAIKQYKIPYQLIDDYISIGNYALVKAAKSFNPDESRFSTYAYNSILNAFKQEFKENSKKVKVIDSSIIDNDADSELENNKFDLLNVLECEDDFVEEICKNDLINSFHNTLIRILTDSEYKVLVHKYGVFGNKKMTEQEIAKEMNLTQPAINFQLKRIVNKIKDYYKTNNIDI